MSAIKENLTVTANQNIESRASAVSAADGPGLSVTIIEPPRGGISLNLGELWRYRDLLMLMIWRDISARYRQSVIGIGWAVIKPVVSMIIFTFIFGRVAGIESDGSPYPLFTYSALLPWMYFSTSLTAATTSVASGGHLIKKAYFPRLIFPLIGVATGLVELIVQLVVLGLLMLYYQLAPSAAILAAPLLIMAAAATALAAGLWLTALNVKYRDVGQALPFLLQTWMWMSPIVYSSAAVPDYLRPIYGLNPLVGIIEGFRWSLLGSTTPDWRMMATSLAVVVMLLVSGLYYFRRTEDTFADIV